MIKIHNKANLTQTGSDTYRPFVARTKTPPNKIGITKVPYPDSTFARPRAPLAFREYRPAIKYRANMPYVSSDEKERDRDLRLQTKMLPKLITEGMDHVRKILGELQTAKTNNVDADALRLLQGNLVKAIEHLGNQAISSGAPNAAEWNKILKDLKESNAAIIATKLPDVGAAPSPEPPKHLEPKEEVRPLSPPKQPIEEVKDEKEEEVKIADIPEPQNIILKDQIEADVKSGKIEPIKGDVVKIYRLNDFRIPGEASRTSEADGTVRLNIYDVTDGTYYTPSAFISKYPERAKLAGITAKTSHQMKGGIGMLKGMYNDGRLYSSGSAAGDLRFHRFLNFINTSD